jgi:trehalose-phosphatase
MGKLLIGLDFDGTISAIVPRPADAALIDGAPAVLDALIRRHDTSIAIVTGRGVPDVRGRAGRDDIFYAGNHGLEIEGPSMRWVHPDAEAERGTIDAIRQRLRDVEADWPEIIIEDKLVSLSVHFRTVEDPAERERIVERVHADAARVGGRVRLMGGRRVVEIRPDIDWDKGTALTKLRDEMAMNDAPTLFIGDDVTDEDAFRDLHQDECDVGILVGPARLGVTTARAFVDSPADVVRFLDALAK